MKYDYEDIGRLELPSELAREFIDLMKIKYRLDSLGNYKWLRKGTMAGVRAILDEASKSSYKNSSEYVLASNDRERAIAAMKGPSATFKQDALELYLSVIANMSDVERVMNGWEIV